MIRPTRCCMAGCTAPAVRSMAFAPALVYCEGHYWDRLKLAGPAPTPPADPPVPPPVQQQLFQPPAPARNRWPEAKWRGGGKRR